MRKKFTGILLFLLIAFCGCTSVFISHSDGKQVRKRMTTLPHRSTSYKLWGKTTVRDSATGHLVRKERYRKNVSCFNTHYAKLVVTRYDSKGKRIEKIRSPRRLNRSEKDSLKTRTTF